MRRIGMLMMGLLLGGCAHWGAQPPQSAGRLDLERYEGTWYELARLPMYFQRRCLESEAHYRLQESGELAVLNRCRTAEGEWIEARGKAWPQEKGRNDRLWVRFDNTFSRLFPFLTKGDYWVLYVDPTYRLALVGSPDRDYLWLLARDPQVSPEQRERLLTVARQQGYDLAPLIWRQPAKTE